VVVSAAHCIHPSTGLDPGTLAQIYFGTDTMGGGTFIDVVEAQYKPDWYLDDPEGDDDVAVLRLAQPAPVSPIPMADLPPTGTPLVIVGFGITSAGGSGSGVKRVGTATVGDIYGEVFALNVAPSSTCNGDSGGTALWNDNGVEKFVGIHTRSDCESWSLDERVDIHLAEFIQPFIDAGGFCGSDGACASNCSMPDPDCPCAGDGFCTGACVTPGADPDCDPACGDDGVCATNCPVADPDCTDCDADGVCHQECASDPDCSSASSSGSGGPPIGADDDDGSEDGDEDDPSEPIHIGGCSAGSAGDTAGAGWLALALAIGARRRRSRGAR
jgi:hypothetical protein